MKPEELRIGNFILDDIDRESKVTMVGMNTLEAFPVSDDGTKWTTVFKPEGIPLTEDWLKRFGFEQGALGSWTKSITIFGNLRELSFGGDYLYLREGKEVYGSGEDDLCVLWNKDVMKQFYVHQLQNLYFALTGEELKLF